jgi:hypothetical protein
VVTDGQRARDRILCASFGVWECAGAGADANADVGGVTLGDNGERESASNGGWGFAGLLDSDCK